MKRKIRLTENELKKMIGKTVRQILNEEERELTPYEEDKLYPRLPCEKSRPSDTPPGNEGIHFPGDVDPEVWDELSKRDIVFEDITDTIDECVRRTVIKNLQRQHFANMVSENISRMLFEDKSDNDMKRNAVMKALKDPKYNHAQLAYALWPDMDKDTARSLFAKKANGTPDNDGVVRYFNDEEINKLYQLIRKK